jgi:hypothetical protein
MKLMTGRVIPPTDLQPAIDALGPVGKKHLARLQSLREDGKITPEMLATAADYERDTHGQSEISDRT